MCNNNITREKLWELIKNSKPNQRSLPDVDKVLDNICFELDVAKTDNIIQVVSEEVKCFKKFQISQHSKTAKSWKLLSGENYVVFDKDELERKGKDETESQPREKKPRNSGVG